MIIAYSYLSSSWPIPSHQDVERHSRSPEDRRGCPHQEAHDEVIRGLLPGVRCSGCDLWLSGERKLGRERCHKREDRKVVSGIKSPSSFISIQILPVIVFIFHEFLHCMHFGGFIADMFHCFL